MIEGLEEGSVEILGGWDGCELGCLEIEGLADGSKDGSVEILGEVDDRKLGCVDIEGCTLVLSGLNEAKWRYNVQSKLESLH